MPPGSSWCSKTLGKVKGFFFSFFSSSSYSVLSFLLCKNISLPNSTPLRACAIALEQSPQRKKNLQQAAALHYKPRLNAIQVQSSPLFSRAQIAVKLHCGFRMSLFLKIQIQCFCLCLKKFFEEISPPLHQRKQYKRRRSTWIRERDDESWSPIWSWCITAAT